MFPPHSLPLVFQATLDRFKGFKVFIDGKVGSTQILQTIKGLLISTAFQHANYHLFLLSFAVPLAFWTLRFHLGKTEV